MKNLILGLLLVFSAPSFAQKPTEFSSSKTSDIFAPSAGGAELLIGVLLPTGSIETQGRSAKYSGSVFGLQYSYGFNQNFAFFLNQNYSYYKIDSNFSGTEIEQTLKGFGNTQIGVKGIVDFTPGFFYYNLNYVRAILEKDKTNSSSYESTAASARPTLNFTIGAGADMESFGLGLILGYSMYQEGDQENESSTGSTTTTYASANGSSWKVYAQYQPSWKIGLGYGITSVDSYNQVRNGTTTQVNATDTKNLSIYGIFPMTSNSEVILEALKPEPKDTNGIDYKIYYLSATYRMEF